MTRAGCVAVALGVLVSGCAVGPGDSGGSGSAGSRTGTGSAGSALVVRRADAPAAAPAVELRSRVTRVAGHLSDVRRERVARQAHATVEDYLEGAFVAAGEGDPYGRFLPALRRVASRDARVLRQADVEVTSAVAWFAVAAPGGRPVGVTARLAVELDPADGPPTSVTGRLLLTREAGGWRVFGYDLARGAW